MSTNDWTGEVLGRYRAGGLAGRVGAGARPAVVVVDLQRGFTDPACPPGFELSQVVAATRTLVDRARQTGSPVLFTAIEFPLDRPDRVWLAKMPALGVLRPGTGWADIDPRLGDVPPGDLLIKQTASGFAGTDLAAELHGRGVDTVLVVGATTSGCVRATVVDACAYDFRTLVVRECVGDREDGPHRAALLDLDAKYADVVALDEALRVLDASVVSAP